MKLNYQFVAAGTGDIIRSKVYRLEPDKGNEPDRGNTRFQGQALRYPIGYPDEILGKYFQVPLRIATQDGKTIDIPEAVVTVTREKNIVTTPIVGGNGTVKEYISDKDIALSITLAIVGVDEQGNITDEYPAQGIKDLCDILDRKEALDVQSDFLTLFDLDGGAFKMVVEKYIITQSTHTNRQEIVVTAVSDYDYVIYYEEN